MTISKKGLARKASYDFTELLQAQHSIKDVFRRIDKRNEQMVKQTHKHKNNYFKHLIKNRIPGSKRRPAPAVEVKATKKDDEEQARLEARVKPVVESLGRP